MNIQVIKNDFWNTYTIPKGWGCKCIIKGVDTIYTPSVKLKINKQ